MGFNSAFKGLIEIIKVKNIYTIEKGRHCFTCSTHPTATCLNTEAPTSYSQESANGSYSKEDKFR